MAELADAADSKSAGPCGHGGSTPPPGTSPKSKTFSFCDAAVLQAARRYATGMPGECAHIGVKAETDPGAVGAAIAIQRALRTQSNLECDRCENRRPHRHPLEVGHEADLHIEP